MQNTLKTIATFVAVAIVAFLAADPADLPAWTNAAGVAIVAGLAAIGITPPTARQPTATEALLTLDDLQRKLRVVSGRLGTLEDSHAELDEDSSQAADTANANFAALHRRLNALETGTTAPEPEVKPEPPAPEVPQ